MTWMNVAFKVLTSFISHIPCLRCPVTWDLESWLRFDSFHNIKIFGESFFLPLNLIYCNSFITSTEFSLLLMQTDNGISSYFKGLLSLWRILKTIIMIFTSKIILWGIWIDRDHNFSVDMRLWSFFFGLFRQSIKPEIRDTSDEK